MKYIYIYRMTSDTGSAPCIFEDNYAKTDLLTLACCKGGQIRKGKDIKTGLRHTIGKKHKGTNDVIYVVGIYKKYILYVAKLSQIVTMNEYYSSEKYSKRKDYIYDKDGKRNAVNSYFHPIDDHLQHRRDWNGEYVLLSEEFSYNGRDCFKYDASKIKDYLPKRQESLVYNECSDGFESIFSFIETTFEKHSKNDPITKINGKCKGCNQK